MGNSSAFKSRSKIEGALSAFGMVSRTSLELHDHLVNVNPAGYFFAMKRATKERAVKRRKKPLVQTVNPSEHAAPITLLFPLPESILTRETSLVDRQTVFFKIRFAIG